MNNHYKKNYSKTYYFGLLILGGIIGLLFMAHFSSNSLRIDNINYSNEELQNILISLEKEQNSLKKSINQKEQEIINQQKKIKEEEKISQDDLNLLNSLKNSAGLLSIKGEGVIINLSDGEINQKFPINNFLVHASDLRDLLNFLWLAGASACSINEERIVFPTSIDCVGNTILINNSKISPPYKISVLINQKKFQNLWENNNYLKEFKNKIKKNYLKIDIQYSSSIEVPAYSGGLIINQN